MSRISLGVNSSHCQLGETEAVKAHSVQTLEKAGADANVLACQLATGAKHTLGGTRVSTSGARCRRKSAYAEGGTLTELMSTVHTETSAAAPSRKTNANSSKHDRSDRASGIFTRASTGTEGAGQSSILLRIRDVVHTVTT